jgi:hypothetical protein
MLLLQEEGKLSLDDKVGKFLPDLTRSNEVSIRQILSHTSGYQDYWPQDYVMPMMLQPITAQKILDTWARKPLDFEPGTKWQYSNTKLRDRGSDCGESERRAVAAVSSREGVHAAWNEKRRGYRQGQTG